jgi:DNA-binding CsgD family transcriptional regulator/tetratricopeptide (TPR) repeat protein
VVRGGAGVGKSRLVREMTSWAEAQGGTVLVGRCTATAQATPLRAIREALLGAARRGIEPDDSLGPYLPTLAVVVPDWRDGTLAPPVDWVALLGEATLRLLSQLGASATSALVVEDVQWADPETRAVIEYVADNVNGARVMLVVTARDGEPGAGSDLTYDMVRRRAADELVVQPLDAEGVVEMARACLDGDDPPAELVDALVARSGGVPLLVEELIAAARGAGWDTVAAAVPGSVLASVGLRLEELPEDGRRLLIVAALLGCNFDWSLAASVAQVAEPRAAELLTQARRLQLVDAEDAGVRFHHALTCDAVRAAAPPAELELFATSALRAIDDGSDDVERCLLGVELAMRVGRTDQAAELLLKAASRSMTSGALSSAAALASRARELASDNYRRGYDQLLLEISVQQGNTAQAVSLGRDLLRRGSETGELADIHLLLGEAELAAGHLDQAAHHAADALDLGPDDARRARALALAAQVAIADDDHTSATDQASQALALAAAVGDAAVQCEALEVIGRVERGSDLAAAERAFQRAFDVAAGASLPLWRVRALQELGTIDLYDTLRLDRLRTARAEAAEIGALATMAMVDLQLAAAHNERGESVDAIAAARRCAEVSAQFGLSSLAMSHAIEGMAHARRGDAPAMQQALDRSRATSQDIDDVEASVWGNMVPVYLLVRGELADAAAGFDRGMELLRRRPTTTFPFPGLWALVRTLLDDGGDEAREEVARLPVDTPVSRRTLIAADAVALGRNGEPGAATARFLDVDAVLDFEGGQFRRALLRLLVAPAAHHDGWGTPEPWLREALARFEQLELDVLAGRCRQELRRLGAAVPRRSSVAASPVPPSLAALGVTGRELDVLRLAASGSSNREMAERLFISPRTVDKHVERLVQKSGVPRSGFAQLLAHADGLDT